MHVEIASELQARIMADTSATPAVEVCGLLLGDGNRVTAIEPCRNVAVDPSCRFEIDPAALLAAHRGARVGGPAVIGCYHSHPSGRAEPSPRDAADAAPDGTLWLVATGQEVTAWIATADGPLHGRFAPVALRPAVMKAR